MFVYVLLGRIDYEGDILLGVYSTRDLAEARRDDVHGFDAYEIIRVEIDAQAVSHF